MKKAMIKILILMGICGILAGCGSPKDDVVEITMIHGWGSTEYDHVVMRQIYEEFEKVHPEIHLNMVAMPSSTDVISKVGDLLTVGEIPDIVFTGGDGRESIYSFMMEEGYAVDLMPYILEDQEFEANVSPVIMENWTTENGNLYTVSDVLLMGGYWYNEEIFEKAGIDNIPRTWEEWMEACRKIKKSDGKTMPIILDANHIAYLMTTILADEGLAQLKEAENLKIQVNSSSFDKMLSRLREISKYATLAGDYNYRDTLASFNAGESAIYINGVWANFMIDENLKVAYAPFPSDDGNGIATKSACVGYILGNTGDEKRIEASVKFLKYMLSEEVAVKIMEKTGQVPSNPNVKITEERAGVRFHQAVSCVENAGLIVETPENLWDLSEKKEYGENVILYLQNRIGEDEFRERLSRL